MTEPTRPGRASLTSRLLGVYAVIFVVVIVVFSAVVTSAVSTVLEQQIVEDLADQAAVIDSALAPSDRATATAMAAAADARLTIIDRDGVVLFDSQTDAAAMENHGSRPEVIGAWETGTGTDSRSSDTLGGERLYVAVRSVDASRVIRLSVTAEQLSEDLAGVRLSVIRAAAVGGILGLVLVWTGSRRLARPVIELTAIAEGIADGALEAPARRSAVAEVDRLGVSMGRMASQLGRRIAESDAQRTTLESVLEALPQGVVLLDKDDEIIYANETARSLLGSFGDRLSSIAPRGVQRCVQAAREGTGGSRLEVERGSPPRVLGVNATRLEADERILVVVFDVTERYRVEAIRRDFVADASHELKTPVAAVLASSEALQLALTRDPDRAATFAGRTQQAAQQLSRIVEDLLDLSRLEASDQAEEVLPLDKVVEREVEGFRTRARESEIELVVDTSPVRVLGSAADLALAVRNLCDNAVRYTNAGGTVTVAVRPDSDGSALIVVSDTGVGIPTRALERVFERFYRVDEARSRATGGTGLGLSIVRHVVERHGGSVTVTSQLGVGSTFTIRLPITENTSDHRPV